MMRHVLFLLLAGQFVLASSCSSGRADNSAEESTEGSPVPREFVVKNQADKVEEAIRNGAAVDGIYDDFDATPLMIATSYRAHDVVEVLLTSGADPNFANEKGWSVLANSVIINNRTAVKLLVRHGADVNFQDRLGGTALMLAAHLDFVDMAKLLLAKGAKVDTKNGRGQTALWKAARRGSLKTARLLVKHGAAIDVEDADGKSPRDIAKEEERSEMVAYLEAQAANGK